MENKIVELYQKAEETEELMKRSDIWLVPDVVNPYWVFQQVNSQGMDIEIIQLFLKENRIDWNLWHESWYQSFEFRHKVLSGLGEKQRQRYLKKWKTSEAHKYGVQALKKLLYGK